MKKKRVEREIEREGSCGVWEANAKDIGHSTGVLGCAKDIGGSQNPLGLLFSVGPPNDSMDPLSHSLSSLSFS